MREVTRFVLFVNVAPMKSHELRKFHEIFVYSIGATFTNKTNLVTSGTPLFTIFEIAKIQSNLGLEKPGFLHCSFTIKEILFET